MVLPPYYYYSAPKVAGAYFKSWPYMSSASGFVQFPNIQETRLLRYTRKVPTVQ
jgi:hypothetical protein